MAFVYASTAKREMPKLSEPSLLPKAITTKPRSFPRKKL